MVVVFAILSAILGTVFRGYVLSIMWAWFIAEPLHVPFIGIGTAVGISMTFGMLSGEAFRTVHPQTDKPQRERLVGQIGASLIAPWIILLLAAIVHNLSR